MNDETKPKIPFNLERFKAGQKALTREGHVATFVGICEKCENFYRLLVLIEGDDQVTSYSLNGEMHNCIGTYSASRYDLVSMVSRHQHLIDSYDPEDTWQIKTNSGVWCNMGLDHLWTEERDYRLHPHNDLIKAYKKGAKIECKHKGDKWRDASSDDIRAWYEEAEYRIKQEPEFTYPIYKKHIGDIGLIVKFLSMTEGEIVENGKTGFIVGQLHNDWWVHTDASVWQDWTPTRVYEWIHEANAGNVNYFVSSWVADEDVEYFFGLDAPKQKYKTGRSMEVEV